MHQRARTDPSGGRGATRVPTGTQGNADLVEPSLPSLTRQCVQQKRRAKARRFRNMGSGFHVETIGNVAATSVQYDNNWSFSSGLSIVAVPKSH